MWVVSSCPHPFQLEKQLLGDSGSRAQVPTGEHGQEPKPGQPSQEQLDHPIPAAARCLEAVTPARRAPPPVRFLFKSRRAAPSPLHRATNAGGHLVPVWILQTRIATPIK